MLIAHLADDTFKVEVYTTNHSSYTFLATALHGGRDGSPIIIKRQTGLTLSQAIKECTMSLVAEYADCDDGVLGGIYQHVMP